MATPLTPFCYHGKSLNEYCKECQPMTNARELAEKILNGLYDYEHYASGVNEQDVVFLEFLLSEATNERDAFWEKRLAEARDEVHKEIAAKQALVQGESAMLDGKLVTNEELYKQPTDYIKEARAAAYEEGFVKGREQGAFECRHAKAIGVKQAYEECAKILTDESVRLREALDDELDEQAKRLEQLAATIRLRASEASAGAGELTDTKDHRYRNTPCASDCRNGKHAL